MTRMATTRRDAVLMSLLMLAGTGLGAFAFGVLLFVITGAIRWP